MIFVFKSKQKHKPMKNNLNLLNTKYPHAKTASHANIDNILFTFKADKWSILQSRNSFFAHVALTWN